MKNLRFSTVILSLVLAVLAIASAILFTAVYRGAEKALQYEIQENYQRDQRTLNSLMTALFNNIQQVSQGMSNSHELHRDLIANDTAHIAQSIDDLLSHSSGQYIDALVIEDWGKTYLVFNNASLLGVQLPLEEISRSANSPLSIWSSIITKVGDKQYSLLHLPLPVIDEQSGEVIGKVHTFVLLNDNYRIVNQLQQLFGSQAISLSLGNIALDGLQSQQGQLQALRSAPVAIEKGVLSTKNSTFRAHYLRIGNSDNYEVRSLLSNSAQRVLQGAYTTNLYYASALVIMLGIAAMLLIRYLINNALQQLILYAEQVPQSGSPSPFRGGGYYEFIRVGNAVEKMLQRIRDRDKNLSSIIDNSPNLVDIRDLDNNFRLVNKRFAEMFNMTPEQLLSHQEQKILEDGLIDLLSEADQEVLHTHSAIQYKMQIEINNELRIFLVNRFPIIDDQNQLYAIGGIATDVTDIKQTEEQLLLAQQVFAETAEAIIVLDDQQNVLSSNRAFTEMSGFGEHDAYYVIRGFLVRHPNVLQQLKRASRWQGEGTLQCLAGGCLPVLVSATRLANEDGKNRYVLLFSDITKLKIAEQRLERLALYDSLTGLPNRSLFKQRLHEALSHDEQFGTVVMFIDLDHFKNINDSYGHSAGDHLLQQVAERLRTCVQAKDTVARLGGDEFTIILREVCNRVQIEKIAQRILNALSKSYELGALQCFSSASIGISVAGKGEDVDMLLRNADQAMYQAKERGRDVIQFFDASLNAHQQRRHHCEVDLHKALDNNEMFVQYQPRFDIEGQKVFGAEALVRWLHPEQGLIPPGEFIPIAEASNLIIAIGRFVLFEACRQAALWNAGGLQIPVSVNLSPRQLSSGELLRDIDTALSHSGLSAHLLELEITETHVMENISQVLPVLKQIQSLGVKLAIDDFGTGYSSLMYLKKLPVDTLKIDRSFIMDIPGDAADENLLRAIISMSHSLHLRVVAEGVETEKQQQFLREQGCDELQGFLLGKPGSVEQLLALADAQKSATYCGIG